MASQNNETIKGNCHKATKIATPNQVHEKITGNVTITGNRQDATKISPPNQVCEKITGNHQVASQDNETITGNRHEATKIAPPNQVCEKITGNEMITGNHNKATKIAPPNQVHEFIKGNCKEASDIGTFGHIKHEGLRRSPQVKGTRMKIDDPDYRASNDRNDDDTSYIPDDDSSIVADDSSEDTPSCPKKTLGKLTRKNCPHR